MRLLDSLRRRFPTKSDYRRHVMEIGAFAVDMTSLDHVDIYPDDSMHTEEISCSGVTITDYQNGTVEMGVTESVMKPKDMKDFVASVATLCHEWAHVMQFESILSGSAEPDLVYDKFATRMNRAYYELTYGHDISEIAAEQCALIATYNYIACDFPGKDPFKCVYEYAKNRKDNGEDLYELVNLDGVCTIEDLRKSFDDALEMASGDCSHYEIDELNDNDDQAKAYMLEHRHVFDRFAKADTKVERDKILTAIYMNAHPDERKYLEKNPSINVNELDALLLDRDMSFADDISSSQNGYELNVGE